MKGNNTYQIVYTGNSSSRRLRLLDVAMNVAKRTSSMFRGLENAPAVIDVVTSQGVASSDAQKGLGFVPDYQALTAWDDAERKRREET